MKIIDFKTRKVTHVPTAVPKPAENWYVCSCGADIYLRPGGTAMCLQCGAWYRKPKEDTPNA